MASVFILISGPEREAWARELATVSRIADTTIFTGTPAQAAAEIERRRLSPTHILLDVGKRGVDILPEIDQLAQQCNTGTRVLGIGDTTDPLLQRGLLSRGVIDYLTLPREPLQVVKLLLSTGDPLQTPAFTTSTPLTNSNARVISFLSAGSGDGASTTALNTAYALSRILNGRTILIDADYQYGMIAKQLNLHNQYGIRELFEHPERGIDATLIKRMVVSYGKLDVITAPSELQFLPPVSAQVIADLIASLKQNYDTIVIDLPHIWLPWIATILQNSTHVVLVAQLWLKSVSHAARMTRMVRELGIPANRLIPVINRFGAKFKEAVKPKDFERVCGVPIRYSLANDIRTVTAAETVAKTVLEMEESPLKHDIIQLANGLVGKPSSTAKDTAKAGILSRLKG